MTPDDLFALDPEEFVAARDALAAELKPTDPEVAAQVKRLRKPTVVAWAINVAARAHPAEVEGLLAAGERLRAAQEEALRGDAGALRDATAARRKAVAALAGRVAEVLGDRASAHAGAVSATLEAATVDTEVADLVERGTLDKERSAAAAGFGFGEVGDWTPPPPKPKAEPKAATPKEQDDTLARDLAAATKEAAKRAGALHDAEERVRELKEQLAEATAAVRAARTRAQKAELQVEQLRQKAWEQGERRRKKQD